MYYFCTYSHLNAEKHVDCFRLAKKKKNVIYLSME